jgi:TPR repeat protein
MPRYHRFELALFGVALAAIVIAVIFAGRSWHERHSPPSNAAVDRGVAALHAFDYTTARRSFTEAAQAGDIKGQIWLADMMENGLGEAPDGAGAERWLTRAANAGSAEAARRLGELYRNGRVVIQDLGQARTWLQRAADEGDRIAARDLGELYAAGLGVKKDLVTAYQWLNFAASDGDPVAARVRDRVASQLAPADLRRGQDLAEAKLAGLSAKDAPPAATIAADAGMPAPSVAGG